MSKKCVRCGEEKNEQEFRPGRHTCKECYALRPIRVMSDEWRAKISAAKKGKKNPEHSLRLKGKKHSAEHKLAISESLKGRKYSIEHRLAISAGHLRYNKGVVIEDLDHYRERLEYKIWREKVLERDGHKCTACGSINRLHVHHINGYYSCFESGLLIENGQTLCQSCHTKLHHRNGDFHGRNNK